MVFFTPLCFVVEKFANKRTVMFYKDGKSTSTKEDNAAHSIDAVGRDGESERFFFENSLCMGTQPTKKTHSSQDDLGKLKRTCLWRIFISKSTPRSHPVAMQLHSDGVHMFCSFFQTVFNSVTKVAEWHLLSESKLPVNVHSRENRELFFDLLEHFLALPQYMAVPENIEFSTADIQACNDAAPGVLAAKTKTPGKPKKAGNTSSLNEQAAALNLGGKGDHPAASGAFSSVFYATDYANEMDPVAMHQSLF